MTRTRAPRRKAVFLRYHALSLTTVGILLLWVFLYLYADPKTHSGSFFGNAIADWTGVVVTVIATKYFYEIGSAEQTTGPPLPEPRHRDYTGAFVDYFFGAHRSGLDGALLKNGFRREVRTGSGKHCVGVDATPGACPPD